ncbi:hypothetical protein M8494_14850 [Serratia ureilytica]
MFNRQASVNDMAKRICVQISRRWPETSARSIAAEPRRHCLRSISNRPVLLQLQTFALHDSFRRGSGSQGCFDVAFHDRLAKNIETAPIAWLRAIVFLFWAIQNSRNRGDGRVEIFVSTMSPSVPG